MFIETLGDLMDKQNSLQGNMTVTRYLKANLQSNKPEFKSMNVIQNKKRFINEQNLIKAELLTCKASSLSTGISSKPSELAIALIAEKQVAHIEIGDKKMFKEGSSNLLRDTFGKFRVYKSYATSTKSNFQLASQKLPLQSPIVVNICYKAPRLVGKTPNAEKRLHAHSQSLRPLRNTAPQKAENFTNRNQLEGQNKKQQQSIEQMRLPTLESKPSYCSTQNLDKPLAFGALSTATHHFVKKTKGYLQYDKECLALLKNNVHLEKRERFMKCRKIPILSLTAERVCVIDSQNLQLIYSDSPKDQQPIEIASLTKVVTALLSILICRKYDLNIKTYRCRVSDQAAFMPGTSAQLQVGDTLTVEQLLYGLMLPSGNDAAVALADNLGRIIIKNKKKPCKLSAAKVFVSHMNILYREVIGESPPPVSSDSDAEQIVHLFQNPSGLSLYPNTTTPEKITLFAAIAYKNELIKQVVSTKQFQATIKNDRYGIDRRVSWTNTNKLLWKGWDGIKTGTTENAGPCLLAKQSKYIVGLFNCGGQSKRFAEAAQLIDMVKKAIE